MIDKLSLDQALIEQIRRGELEGLQGETDEEGRRIDSIGAPTATREQEVGFSEAQKGDTLIEGDGNPAGRPSVAPAESTGSPKPASGASPAAAGGGAS
jgi:hypothetical protein